MAAEARSEWGPRFECLNVTVQSGRQLKLAGMLSAKGDLEEVKLLPAGIAGTRPSRSIRAFLVRGGKLEAEGLQDGDHVLVEDLKTLRPHALTLAEVGGRYVIRPASGLAGQPPAGRILGAFIGVIRKRGFGKSPRTTAYRRSQRTPEPTQLSILRGQLGMLEVTYAETKNPRLRRALRNEADLIRRQLHNGAPEN